MKRLVTFSFIILISAALSSFSEAKQKPEQKQNGSPCITDCNKEHKRCIDATRKSKKAERKELITECNKASKDCKAKCDKPEETENK